MIAELAGHHHDIKKGGKPAWCHNERTKLEQFHERQQVTDGLVATRTGAITVQMHAKWDVMFVGAA